MLSRSYTMHSIYVHLHKYATMCFYKTKVKDHSSIGLPGVPGISRPNQSNSYKFRPDLRKFRPNTKTCN